jgi:hypothetical protein
MKQHVVWVHGIGTHRPGYSKQEGWQAALQAYWPSADDQFAEVCWDTVMSPSEGTRRGARRAPSTPTEDAQALELQVELERTIAVRQAAIDADPNRPAAPPATRPRRGTQRGIFGDTLKFLNTGVGDFVRYLTNNQLREAVKDQFKSVVEPLLAASETIAVVSHSWGTVVAYEALHDLSAKLPGKRVAVLFTLGSPLWMPPIRPMLRPAPAKPANVDRWVNIAAHGDPIGGWLYTFFPTDRDFQAPGIAGVSAHSSYFTMNNAGVMQDLVSHFLIAA